MAHHARPKKRSMFKINKMGRRVRKDPKRMRAALKGARKRRGRRQSAATKMKRRRSLMRTIRSGRTKSGRRSLRRKHH